MTKNPVENLKKVTWEHLEEWAGSRSVQRGEKYAHSGKVKNVRITPNGQILANVFGTMPYVTLVTVKGQGRSVSIVSACSCPVGSNCKHGVATLLAYTAAVKDKRSIPVSAKDDPDLESLLNPVRDEEDDDVDDFEDAEEDDEEEVVPRKRSARGKKSTSKELSEFIRGKTKKELEDLVLNLSRSKADVHSELVDQAVLAGGKVNRIVASLRREIASVTSSPSWRSNWSGEGDLADFGRIEKNLKSLLDQGHYDAVLQVGDELVAAGIDYIETCDDEGEAGEQLTDCLNLVFKALDKIDWPLKKKLLWAIDAELKDDWDLCQGATKVLEKVNDSKAWSEVADTLFERLRQLPKGKTDEFSRSYKRDRLTNFIIDALKAAKRKDEILPLLATEARITGSWVRYVEQLLAAKRTKEARTAAGEGIRILGDKLPGITKSLRETIAKIAENEGDYAVILDLRRNDFLENPCVETMKQLRKAANKSKNWPAIQAWAMEYLKTGKLGSFKPELENSAKKLGRFRTFPTYEVLIDLAIDEKNPDDVLHWFDTGSKQKGLRGDYQREVAQAIEKSHPERSLEIWRRMAEHEISLTNPSAYQMAAGYLKHVRNIMSRLGKEKEWTAYLEHLQEVNKRKPRCIQELRRLTRERLI